MDSIWIIPIIAWSILFISIIDVLVETYNERKRKKKR